MKFNFKFFIRLTGIIVFIIILFFIDYAELLKSIKDIQIGLFVLSFFLIIPLYIFKALRWNFLLSIQNIRYSFKNVFIVFFSSNYIAFITPGRIGELSRALYLHNDLNIPLSKSFPTVIMDRLFDIYILLIISIAGFLKYSLYDSFNVLTYIFISILVIFPLLLLSKNFTFSIIKVLLSPGFVIKLRQNILSFLTRFYSEIKLLLNFKLVAGIILTSMAYLFLFLIGYIISESMDLHLSFITVAFFISIANILSFIPISISGIGTREASLILLFNFVGYSKEQAIVFSTLLFITFYIIGGFYGFICYLIKPINFKDLNLNKNNENNKK